MDGNPADGGVIAHQRDLMHVDEVDLALNPVLRVVRWAHPNAFAGMRVAVLRLGRSWRRRFGGLRDGKRLRRRHVGPLAVADRGHAIAPVDEARVGRELLAAIDVPTLEEPHDVIGREIGDAGRAAQEKRPPVLQHVGEPGDLRAHQMKVADRRLAHRLDRGRRQAVQAGAVLVQAGRHVVGVDARHEQRHRPHELMLGPPGDGFGEAACRFRKQGR